MRNSQISLKSNLVSQFLLILAEIWTLKEIQGVFMLILHKKQRSLLFIAIKSKVHASKPETSQKVTN